MSLGVIAAAMRAGLDHLARARASAAAGVGFVTGARDRIAALSQGSGRPELARVVAAYAAGIRALREADALVADAATVLAGYADRIGVDMAGPTPDTSTVTEPPRAPSWVRQAAAGLPHRPDGKGPTRGRAFTADGTDVFDRQLVSGHRIAPTTGLRPIPDTPGGWPWTLTDHVESLVAARMREPDGPREVTLVLNNVPCTRGRFGCEKILRHLIPAGSRLTVFIADPAAPDGVRFHQTYHGTGKAIAS